MKALKSSMMKVSLPSDFFLHKSDVRLTIPISKTLVYVS